MTAPQTRNITPDLPPRNGPKKGTLAAIVGLFAAGMLLTTVPAEESGRKVAVTVAPDGSASVKHVAGKQYLNAYLDIVGVPTICDGITKGVKMGQKATEAQCAAKLEEELIIHATGVMRCTPGLDPNRNGPQIVAAVSLAYNVGVGGYCKSTAARRFNEGRYRAGCDAMLAWNKAGGRVNKGLVARRGREHAICVKGL